MYISEVRIYNFRIFKDLILKLNQGLNILVGENDSGKSALIDAIRLTLGTQSKERSFINEQDFHCDTDELRIQLKLVDIDKQAYRFVEHLSHEDYEDEGCKKRRSVLFIQLNAHNTGMERRGYPYIKSTVRSGADGNGLAIESDIREFLSATYLKPLRDAEAELSSGRASRLSQILSSSKDIRVGMEDILTVIASANEELLSDEQPLKKSAANIQEQYFHELIFEKDKSRLGAHIDIAGVRQDELAKMPEHVKRRYLRSLLEGLSLTLTDDGRAHGLGYHNLLFMGAELLLLRQEADNEFPLLLIEEPEAHIHPQLQMKLLQFINGQSKTAENPDGVQCILSTHSPNITAKADPSEIIMLSGGGAWPLRPGETELEMADYIYLRKFLDVTKANIFFAKGIIFVEGDGEHILLPELARLLGRPLENYGVSIVKYDNSGSWKRFAKLFLRKGCDDNEAAWHPSKICVLRDLDLWPDCAEKKSNGSNLYGFITKKSPDEGWSKGNLGYWEKTDDAERAKQCDERVISHKTDNEKLLERQRVKVFISDRWTFEFCLARYGLLKECCMALGSEEPDGGPDEQATFVQQKVSKTDFAYKLATILEVQLTDEIATNAGVVEADLIREKFASELRERLPPYIVDAIEYVTTGAVSKAKENSDATVT